MPSPVTKKQGQARHARRRVARPLPAARESIKSMFDDSKASAANRSCGDCRACCSVLKLRLDGPEGPNTVLKDGNTPCQHLHKRKDKGCGIYENRPTDCSTYTCYWLEGFGEKRDRPDRLGMIVDTADGIIWGIWGMAKIKAVSVHEVWPGANRNPRFRAAIVGMIQRGVAVLYHGTGKDLPRVMAPADKLEKLNQVLAALEVAANAATEHAEAGHAKPLGYCPVCVGRCPAHGDDPLAICGVCAQVQEAKADLIERVKKVTTEITERANAEGKIAPLSP